VTDPQPTVGGVLPQPGAAEPQSAQPEQRTAQPRDHVAQPGDMAQPGDVVTQLESAADRLRSADGLDTMPLTELAEQLAALHGQLQAALSELDRT